MQPFAPVAGRRICHGRGSVAGQGIRAHRLRFRPRRLLLRSISKGEGRGGAGGAESAAEA